MRGGIGQRLLAAMVLSSGADVLGVKRKEKRVVLGSNYGWPNDDAQARAEAKRKRKAEKRLRDLAKQ